MTIKVKKVIVVDNREEDREQVKEYLEDNNCHVRTLGSLEELEGEILSDKPDIVIMGIMFPPKRDTEGIKEYEKLKEKGLLNKENTIFMSYRDDKRVQKLIEKLGCSFFKKPHDFFNLIEAVNKA